MINENNDLNIKKILQNLKKTFKQKLGSYGIIIGGLRAFSKRITKRQTVTLLKVSGPSSSIIKE